MTENSSTTDNSNLEENVEAEDVRRASVTLFKSSGKYYTEESWRVPENAIGPYDMASSPDFRRISDGPVLVKSEPHTQYPNDENWGYPHIL